LTVVEAVGPFEKPPGGTFPVLFRFQNYNVPHVRGAIAVSDLMLQVLQDDAARDPWSSPGVGIPSNRSFGVLLNVQGEYDTTVERVRFFATPPASGKGIRGFFGTSPRAYKATWALNILGWSSPARAPGVGNRTVRHCEVEGLMDCLVLDFVKDS